MKSKPSDQILAALQQTISAALSHWLDDNKGDVLLAFREAVLEMETVKHERHEQPATRNRLLTVAEVAQRWQFHPESVRRMIRHGRVPRVMVGRGIRVALAAVEAIERGGSVPGRR